MRPDARFVQQTRRGKGNALAVGFAEATGDTIVMFDADGSADPNEIQRYVDALTGVRDAGNKGLTMLTNIAFRTRYTDLCYRYNAFWSDVLRRLALPSPVPVSDDVQWGDGFQIETLINCRVAVSRLRVAEVPSIELLRVFGASNLHAVKDGLRVLKTLATEWRRARRNKAADVAVKEPRRRRLLSSPTVVSCEGLNRPVVPVPNAVEIDIPVPVDDYLVDEVVASAPRACSESCVVIDPSPLVAPPSTAAGT